MLKKEEKTCKIFFMCICRCGILLFVHAGLQQKLGSSNERRLTLKNIYERLSLSKQKHNSDYVKGIIHHHELSYNNS